MQKLDYSVSQIFIFFTFLKVTDRTLVDSGFVNLVKTRFFVLWLKNGYQISGNFYLILLYVVPGVRIRIRVDPPILDPLDPYPPKNVDPDPRSNFLRGKYGNFYIIDQKSQQPWYFFTVN